MYCSSESSAKAKEVSTTPNKTEIWKAVPSVSLDLSKRRGRCKIFVCPRDYRQEAMPLLLRTRTSKPNHEVCQKNATEEGLKLKDVR